MRSMSTNAFFLVLSAIICPKTASFVAPGAILACNHAGGSRGGVTSMSAESTGPTSRGQAIAAAAAGLLATVAGVSAAGAVTVPEALPACPTEGNCVSSTSFKLVMQGRYMAPWSYTGDSQDASVAFSKLAEAGVMIRIRNGHGNSRARHLSADTLSKADREALSMPGNAKRDDGYRTMSLQQDSRGTVASRVDGATDVLYPERAAEARQGCSLEGGSTGGDDDLWAMDCILQEALGNGGKGSLTPTARSRGRGRVETRNESSSTARVYLRASGGLARLAGATVVASTTAAANSSDTGYSGAGSSSETEETASASEIGFISQAAAAGGADGASTDASNNHQEESRSGVGCAQVVRACDVERRAGDQIRFVSMLSAVTVALKGGERLARLDVFNSGLLGDPCARAMKAMGEIDQEDTATAAAAGAAALLLSRVVEDVSVRVHVAKSNHLLSGLVGLIRANSTPSLDVQAAASVLSAVLIGRTASIAAKTLSEAASTSSAVSTLTGQAKAMIAGWPATAVGEALLAWRDGIGSMKGAPACTGSALCSVLANLAMNETFRGSFAEPFLSKSAGSGGRTSTVAAALVLVAGDTKADRSEARTVALAALVNACLHNLRVQAATFSAGGLSLALATLSLGGEDRARYAPPLVAARSAGLLARLSPHPGALEAMVCPGVFDRIVQATVRSSTLGGDLYTPTAPAHHKEDTTVDASMASAAKTAAHAIERENLVRTLGSILRSKSPPTPPAAGYRTHAAASPAPSSNVPAPLVVVAKDSRAYLVDYAEKAKLAAALVSFLPPAREDGVEGVTAASAPLRPEWRAPPAVTANVCACLLHLLDSEPSGHIAKQVVGAGGIPRLVSLFANSGVEGGGLSARTNAAICLAKLAREPLHKQMIAELRGMEMLVQAGSGLAA